MRKLCILLCLCLLLSGCSTGKDNSLSDTCKAGHTDEANDGFCDRCSTFLLVMVDFYCLNDLHGKLADTDTHPGVDELSTYIQSARKTDDHVILLSAGDMWQGSSESNLTQGLMMTDWMNEMDFDAMTMGNHEYDWGESPIAENDSAAQFPFLAINIYDRETNKQVSYCESSTVVDLGDLQIGIIGAIGDCYSSISADKVEDVYFKTGSDLTALVKNESAKLRSEGADYIVYLLHDGYTKSRSGISSASAKQLKSYYDTELSNGYVDLVFEGHTHQKYILKDNYGVYHLQGGGDNEGITHAEIAINTANKKASVQAAELVSTGAYASEEDHPIVDQLLRKYDEDIRIATQVLGRNAVNRNGNEMRQRAADMYYQKGMELWGKEYDIVLGGGFMSIRDPGYLAVGDVTYSDLYSLFPFDNQLVLCAIEGDALLERFFLNDDGRYFLCYGDYGRQVKDNIQPDKTYYIVTDTYSSLYKPNKLTEIQRYDENIYARDLLAQYAKDGGFE